MILAPLAARAGDNDLQLWRLGHPDAINTCTVCDGSDRVSSPGDASSQSRFARLAASIGLAMAPPFGEPAATTGQAGLELGFSTNVALPKLDPGEWPSVGTASSSRSPGAWVIPTIRARKGFGGSLEVGTAISLLAGSQMVALSGELRWALLDGIDYAPDVALRAWGSRILGSQELDLAMAGGDITLSKSIGVGGTVTLEPYGQYGITCINVSSGVIDFDPAHEDPKDPTADDGIFRSIGMFSNRYNRFVVGMRLKAGVVVVGAEGAVAFGTNPIMTDGVPANTTAATQFTRELAFSGHLGFHF